jgi:saccharopine dehydrogenase-like NADP-dependent oxidoreductase
MSNKVSILGGRGRIGCSVALDLLTHTQAQVTITGRAPSSAIPPELVKFGDRVRYLPMDLGDRLELTEAIATGIGTGSVSELILSEQIKRPGVWPIEQVLTTARFEEILTSRKIEVRQNLE